MKTLGRTNQGGYIAEFTHEEYEALRKLAYALGYETEATLLNTVPDLDYSKAFSAIELYAKHRYVAQTLLEMSQAVIAEFERPKGDQ